jgi:uncharacterized membrane protein YoaK (UPF0700 family)
VKRIWPVILLAWIAGFVDALGYLALSKVFTAHMSGNTAAIGAQLGQSNWLEPIVRGLAIPGFILGVAAGVVTDKLAPKIARSARLAPAFVLEGLLLLGFLLLDPNPTKTTPPPGTFRFFVLVWLLAMAMGVQNATLRRARGVRVRTTYVSGMLTNMAEELTLYLIEGCKSFPGFHAQARQDRHGGRALIFASIFLSFLIGAICGGLGEVRWGTISLVVPLTGLFALIAQKFFTPIQALREGQVIS